LVGPETLPPPVLPVATQVAPVTPAGSGSKTLAPVTALGPGLLTTRVGVAGARHDGGHAIGLGDRQVGRLWYLLHELTARAVL
jgi:hypothetical protein